MPIDKDGNRADIVAGSETTIGRMNLGRVFEAYIASACIKVHRQISEMCGVTYGEKNIITIENKIQSLGPHFLEKLKHHVLGFYRCINSQMYNWFETGAIEFNLDYAAHIVHKGVSVWIPHNNELENHQIVDYIENSIYTPIRDSITYIGNSGTVVQTVEPVRIAPLYFLLLEKIADDWGAVSSAKLQTTGVITGNLSRDDKYGLPYRPKATRVIGEAEGRIIAATMGAKYYAELLDRNNNPVSHEMCAMAILEADKPTNIARIIDRDSVSLGGSKPLQTVKHLLQVSGRRLVFKDYKAAWLEDIFKPE